MDPLSPLAEEEEELDFSDIEIKVKEKQNAIRGKVGDRKKQEEGDNQKTDFCHSLKMMSQIKGDRNIRTSKKNRK